MWIIGADEAGRGPVIGPLVVCAFSCPAEDVELLVEAGVKDSKLLSAKSRGEIFSWLEQTSIERGWDYHIHVSPPDEIDHAMMLGTLNEHEVNLFAHCILNLGKKDCGEIQLDACDSNEMRFGNNVSRLIEGRIDMPNWNLISQHGADNNYPAVAAASIIAKVSRDAAIAELQEQMSFPIGSGYPSDSTTMKAVKLMLEGDLPHFSLRWRWETVRREWLAAGKGDVPERNVSSGTGPKPAQRTLWG